MDHRHHSDPALHHQEVDFLLRQLHSEAMVAVWPLTETGDLLDFKVVDHPTLEAPVVVLLEAPVEAHLEVPVVAHLEVLVAVHLAAPMAIPLEVAPAVLAIVVLHLLETATA